MRDGQENRHREYHQTFRSEIKTLALCDSLTPDFDNGGTYVKARIRTVKADRRIPLFLTLAFEPSGGSPDDCILARQIPNPANPAGAGPSGFLPGIVPAITVAECVLLNRSYVPIVRTIGNTSPIGSYPLSQRPGSLGISVISEGDCDAVDFMVTLVAALGARVNPGYVLAPANLGAQDQNPLGQRYGGRWLFQYSMTCTDRLSREEWDTAVLGSNAQVEIIASDAQDIGHIITLHGANT
jgi:hypothetical protein